MSTVRGRPPCLAGGIKGSMSFHWASVRSERYGFRMVRALPSVPRTQLLHWPSSYGRQRFPDSLSVTLTVRDDDTASCQSVFQYVVVYDPSAGFVTGGGWINSPARAYAAAPALDRPA